MRQARKAGFGIGQSARYSDIDFTLRSRARQPGEILRRGHGCSGCASGFWQTEAKREGFSQRAPRRGGGRQGSGRQAKGPGISTLRGFCFASRRLGVNRFGVVPLPKSRGTPDAPRDPGRCGTALASRPRSRGPTAMTPRARQVETSAISKKKPHPAGLGGVGLVRIIPVGSRPESRVESSDQRGVFGVRWLPRPGAPAPVRFSII